jgi:N-carbamoylputrescine amidase
MKVTVCELKNEPDDFCLDWEQLVSHVKAENSNLVLLPEMPFSPWFAGSKEYDPNVWQSAVKAHDEWESRLKELRPAIVLGSRPVNKGSKRLNEAFIWEPEFGYSAVYSKYYLPDEEGFWEASWYDRGNPDFIPVQSAEALIGFLICSDIWFFEHSRAYGQMGVHLIACPRATPKSTLDKWLVAGRAASVVSGAFCLSSNRISPKGKQIDPGGQGWITGPDGEVLGKTSPGKPFLTIDIDLSKADKAKKTYPRYIKEDIS